MAASDKAIAQRSVHYRDLDGLRGILALTVMAFHFGLNTLLSQLTGGLISNAPWGLAVDFFFVLSGFVLCHSFTRQPLSFPQYVRRRVWRLLPVHLVILLPLLPFYFTIQTPSSLDVVANIALVQSNFRIASMNPPSWSAALELSVPALMVIGWAAFTKLGRPGLWIMAAACVVLGGYTSTKVGMDLDPGNALPRALAHLGLGFVLYRLVEGRIVPEESLARTLASLGMIGVLFLTIMGIDLWRPLAWAYPAIVAAVVLVVAQSQSLLSRAPFSWFGTWSYAIYMVHFPVLQVSSHLLGDEALKGNYALKLGLMALALVLAMLISRFVERPLMKLGYRSFTEVFGRARTA